MMKSRGSESGKEFTGLSERVSVILVGTIYGGNLGATARAMNVFGFRNLRIVSPQSGVSEEAQKLAVHSEFILDDATQYNTLGEALVDIDVAVATTRRMGRKRSSYLVPSAMAELIAGLGEKKRAAIVFGPEDTGLSNEDMELCGWVVSIPTFSDFDSFNLSHAVTIMLYEISRYYTHSDPGAPEEAKRLEGLFGHLDTMLRKTGFLPAEGDPRRAMLSLRRMIKRGRWSRNELDLFHSILNAIEKNLK